jgi:spermidine synthase
MFAAIAGWFKGWPLLHVRSRDSLVLYASMFVMGGCGLAYEYTISKVASDLLGNSAVQWAIIIGVMMFFMGVGSEVQKLLSDKHLFDKFLWAELLLGLLGAASPLLMIWAYARAPDYYSVVQYSLISAIGLLIGTEIPLLTRLNAQFTRELKLNLGSVLKMDYIGALAGAMAWVFLLPRFVNRVEGALVLGLANVLVAAVALVHFRKVVKRKVAVGAVCVLLIASTGYGLTRAKDWTIAAEQYLYLDHILYTQTTRYQHIVITESPRGKVSLYINGHVQFRSNDEQIYHENLVHPAMSVATRHDHVLILGGGDGLALREVLKYDDVKQVVLCDLDPAMTRLASSQPELVKLNRGSFADARVSVLENGALVPGDKLTVKTASERDRYLLHEESVAEVEIINLDAANFVEQFEGSFDVIIADFPDPNAVELSKLYSEGFYTRILRRLSRDGVFVQQSTSPYHAKEAFLCIGRTMRAAGIDAVPYHDNVPSFGEWGWWIGGHEGLMPAERVRKRLADVKLQVETRYLTPQLVRASLGFGKGALQAEHDGINTLTRDRVYEYYQLGWQEE